MIFDTNILVYISKNILKITDIIPPGTPGGISIISYIEAMGYPFKSEQEQYFMQKICSSCQIISLNDLIILETIDIRRKHKIKLPDAIIYATAVVEKQPLLTNNTSDFIKLGGGVELINPFTL